MSSPWGSGATGTGGNAGTLVGRGGEVGDQCLLSKSAKLAKSAKPPLSLVLDFLSPQPPVKGSAALLALLLVATSLVGLLLELKLGGGGLAGFALGGAGLGGGFLALLGGSAGVGLSGLGGGWLELNASPPNGSLTPPFPACAKASPPKGSFPVETGAGAGLLAGAP